MWKTQKCHRSLWKGEQNLYIDNFAVILQPKLYAGELLDIVASHFNLKEKEYFGLSFKDDT